MICVLPWQVKAKSMRIPYRHIEKIKINQHTKALSAGMQATQGCVITLLPESPRKPHWESIADGALLKSRLQRERRRDSKAHRLVTDLPNKAATHLVLECLDPESDTFGLLTRGRELAAGIGKKDPASVVIQVAGFKHETVTRIIECVLAALLASVCPMPSYKSDARPAAALKRIDIYGLEKKIDLAQVRAEVMGNHLARWLAALPGNELTPGAYREQVTQIAAAEGWDMKFMDTKSLARKKAGAFLAVVQGSPNPDAGIVQLSYRPQTRGGRKLALVGKGICFDTGGVNVKPARHMNGMQEDMQGSAVALGTLLALSRLGADFPVDCWLALAENHVGSRAYKPNDVVHASNGTSIEVIHTDAEGRMVLADTLVFACKAKPHTLIDYATLTGACIYSLSSRYSGVFSNRDSLLPLLTTAGRSSGERVWPFPLDDDYEEALKSSIADTKQCTLEDEADHILAGRFLRRFVDDGINWVHVDLSASNRKGGLGHIATDTTGFGVRFSLNLLLQQDILSREWN